MLETLANIVSFSAMPVSGFFVVRTLSGSDEKIINLKNLFCIAVLALAAFLIYNIEYGYMITILNFCAMVITYKIIFKLSIFNSFLLSIILMIFVFISDITVYAVTNIVLSADYLRNTGVVMIISNVMVGLLSVILSRNRILGKYIRILLEKFEVENKFNTILISILWIFIISLLCYFIFNSSTTSIDFWIAICMEFVFIVFLINFFKDKNRYINLNEKFDNLYDYIQTMEEYIDNEQMNIHEYKNQLSVIRSMSSSKKIKNYIDSLVNDKKLAFEFSSDLKNLPKGGLKGLLYYKLAQAKERKLNVVVSVSDGVTNCFSKLSLEDTKELSRLVGIFLDNAMEAAVVTKKKNISIEIYKSNDVINIVISNSISNTINLKDIYKKGYTSKGKGRGHGLYFAQKLIEKNQKFQSVNKIVNNYYIQRLIIK